MYYVTYHGRLTVAPHFVKLDIVGHSGDAIQVPFVQSTSSPANDKERLQVLKV